MFENNFMRIRSETPRRRYPRSLCHGLRLTFTTWCYSLLLGVGTVLGTLYTPILFIVILGIIVAHAISFSVLSDIPPYTEAEYERGYEDFWSCVLTVLAAIGAFAFVFVVGIAVMFVFSFV
ncbi:MAG: hypothetical protein NUW37_13930 [Planctomycetes bacterium]|nr:hypothetical protein [Planctomycetota bacterium]